MYSDPIFVGGIIFNSTVFHRINPCKKCQHVWRRQEKILTSLLNLSTTSVKQK